MCINIGTWKYCVFLGHYILCYLCMYVQGVLWTDIKTYYYELIYQLDAIEYLFVYFQLDMFRAYTPIFRSNGCYNFFTNTAYGVLGVVRCQSWGVCLLVACCTATRHQHIHSSGPTPNYSKDTICCICKEIITSIAPEDGRVSPKHVELKVHK